MRIVFHSGYLGAFFSWENLGFNKSAIIDLMRRILMTDPQNNFTRTIRHTRGIDNSIADALSRFDLNCFHFLALAANLSPVISSLTTKMTVL